MTEQILNSQPITMAELKIELEKIKKRDKELGFRANKTSDYLKQFNTLDMEKTKELIEKLKALKIPRFKEEYIIKVVDILPKDVNDLKLILQSYVLTITNENLKKIADILKDYIPAK